jgi:hypothetical protein
LLRRALHDHPKARQAMKKAIALKLIKSKTARRTFIKAIKNPRVRKIVVDQAKRRMSGK